MSETVPGGLQIVARSPVYLGSEPSVSALVIVEGWHGDWLHRTLDSLAASVGEIEIVVLEDSPADPPASEWIAAHPGCPAIALRRSTPGGLDASRRAVADLARARHCLMLDAGMLMTRRALPQLREALSRHGSHTVLSGIFAVHQGGEVLGLEGFQDAEAKENRRIGRICFARTELLRAVLNDPAEARLALRVESAPAIVGHSHSQ